MKKENEIEKLIYLFSKLPGLGQRSARRIVLYLLQDKDIRMKNLSESLAHAANHIMTCQICGNIDSKALCDICTSESRDKNIIAIVETIAELWAIERSGIFSGKYHVLGSLFSATNKRTSNELRLPTLLKRCQDNNVQEIIIATNATLEGQTTAYFITEFFKDFNIRVSRLASGIPIGGELDYLDEGTLSAAINLRQPFD